MQQFHAVRPWRFNGLRHEDVNCSSQFGGKPETALHSIRQKILHLRRLASDLIFAKSHCFQMSESMEHLKLLIKVNNAVGYVLIATIILSPIGFIQVLLGHLVMLMLEERNSHTAKREGWL
jgi:hypothetical protein